MKRIKNLIIVTAVLAALIGVFFLVKTFVKDPDAQPDDTEAVTYPITDIDPNALESVHLKIKDSTDSSAVTVRDMTFTVNSSGSGWNWTEDENVPIANDVFVDMMTDLQAASSTVKMEDVSDAKLEEYGLVSPFIEAEFVLQDGTKTVFHIGNLNNFTSSYYFRNAAEPATVLMLDSYTVDVMNITVKDTLQWDDIPAVTEAKITSLTLESDAHKAVYSYYPNGKDTAYSGLIQWYLSMDGAAEFALSETLATDLTTALTSLSFVDCVHYTGQIPAEYGLSSSATVRMTFGYNEVSKVTDSESGAETEITSPATFVLTLGATDEDGYYYAGTETSQLIYTLAYSDVFGRALTNDKSALQPKALLSYDIDRIDTVKFTAGGTVLNVAVAHGEDGVTYTDVAGGAFDLTKFTAVADTLSALSATSGTALVEPVASAGNDVVFLAEFTYNTGDVSSSALEIRNYSDSYCRVSFMGRDDQLITKADAQSLTDALTAYFDGKNT